MGDVGFGGGGEVGFGCFLIWGGVKGEIVNGRGCMDSLFLKLFGIWLGLVLGKVRCLLVFTWISLGGRCGAGDKNQQ